MRRALITRDPQDPVLGTCFSVLCDVLIYTSTHLSISYNVLIPQAGCHCSCMVPLSFCLRSQHMTCYLQEVRASGACNSEAIPATDSFPEIPEAWLESAFLCN